jgi:integrase
MTKKTKRGNSEGSISKRSDGRYMARIYLDRDPINGKRKRVCFYGRTRQEVAEKLAEALHDKQQVTFVEPHKLTLGQGLDTWLREYKKSRVWSTAFDTYVSHVRRHLTPALGHITLRDLRSELIQHYFNDEKKQGLDASTSRLQYVILSNALAQAEKNGLVTRNVGRLVESPKQARKEQATLTIE